jgi:hypothetical protein
MEETCPCEACISLAICYQKTAIKCQDLYKFLCYINIGGFNGYKPNSGQEITRIYNRYIASTKFRDNKIRFTKEKDYRAYSVYGEYL